MRKFKMANAPTNSIIFKDSQTCIKVISQCAKHGDTKYHFKHDLNKSGKLTFWVHAGYIPLNSVCFWLNGTTLHHDIVKNFTHSYQ